MSVFSPLFSVRESNCFSFSVFLSFPPLSFLPLQALSFAVTPSEDERTNERRRRRRRRNNGFDACSKSSSPFFHFPPAIPFRFFSHSHHLFSSPTLRLLHPFPPSFRIARKHLFSVATEVGARGGKTRKGKGKAKKWEERGNVVVEEFFSALPLCVFPPRVILKRCASLKEVQLPPPVLTFCRRTRYSGGKPKKTPLSPPP